MCRSLFVIIKENCRIVFRQGGFAAVLFLVLVPCLCGIPNLNRERAAACLGTLVAFVGIPLFVSVLKPEQDSDIRDVILIKKFPYHISVLLRIIFAALLSSALIYAFALYMLFLGCEFPLHRYAVRTVGISMLLGGAGLFGSALFRRTLAGFLVAAGFVFLFSGNFAEMVFGGIHAFVMAIEMLLYGTVLLLCKK